jgi:hypothetical protein
MNDQFGGRGRPEQVVNIDIDTGYLGRSLDNDNNYFIDRTYTGIDIETP